MEVAAPQADGEDVVTARRGGFEGRGGGVADGVAGGEERGELGGEADGRSNPGHAKVNAPGHSSQCLLCSLCSTGTWACKAAVMRHHHPAPRLPFSRAIVVALSAFSAVSARRASACPPARSAAYADGRDRFATG